MPLRKLNSELGDLKEKLGSQISSIAKPNKFCSEKFFEAKKKHMLQF